MFFSFIRKRLAESAPGIRETREYHSVVEYLNRTDRACAVTAAAAHDLNNELTVILSGVCSTLADLGPNHPSRQLLLQARAAAQRCAWKASGLLNFSARRGIMPVRDSLDRLMAE
jgi:hypothetical protein